MSRKKSALALCSGFLVSIVPNAPCLADTGIRPAMQSVVSCVYDMVQAKPGVLSTEVYTVGTEEYVIEYKFREKGTIFTGGIGVHDGVSGDGNRLYTNDAPAGQSDNHGLVELDFLGRSTFDSMFRQCHLMPGFDNRMRTPGTIAPHRQKIEMPYR
jgi:hypothetical protein